MPQKEGFNKYIDDILLQVKKNDNLTKLLNYDTVNALVQPNLTDAQKSSLIYTRIFPFRFIPEISTTTCSYLNLGFGNFKEISNVFQAGKIGFYFVSHKNIWKMNGGLRPIFIMEEIKNVANSLEGLGLGKLVLKDCNEYVINDNFIGYYMLYEIIDFKKVI